MALFVLACAVSVFGLTGATCSPCPFQWSQRGSACYRYIDKALSCSAKATHCPGYRRSGRLARTSGLRETGGLEVLTEAVSLLPDLPRYVWLGQSDGAVYPGRTWFHLSLTDLLDPCLVLIGWFADLMLIYGFTGLTVY